MPKRRLSESELSVNGIKSRIQRMGDPRHSVTKVADSAADTHVEADEHADIRVSINENAGDPDEDPSDKEDNPQIEDPDEDEEPLYPGAKLSLRQTIAQFLTIVFKHNVSALCITELLEFFMLMLPPRTAFPFTMHRLKKVIGFSEKTRTARRYCAFHNCYLGEGEIGSSPQCEKCLLDNKLTSEERKHCEQRFFTFDLVENVRFILSDPDVAKYLDSAPSRLDFRHGNAYNYGGFKADDISLSLFIDGTSVHQTSRVNSLWITRATVNNLPPGLRNKHGFITSLCIGFAKAPPDILLRCAINEALATHPDGIMIAGSMRRIFIRILNADAHARCDLMGLNQYNHRHYGCTVCLICGDPGNGPTTVYPLDCEYEYPADIRTHQDFVDSLQTRREIIDSGTNEERASVEKHGVHGLRRCSRLLLLGKLLFSFSTVYTKTSPCCFLHPWLIV